MNKTFWGGLVSVLAALLAYFGIDVSQSEQAVLVNAAEGFVAAAGTVASIWGAYKGKSSSLLEK